MKSRVMLLEIVLSLLVLDASSTKVTEGYLSNVTGSEGAVLYLYAPGRISEFKNSLDHLCKHSTFPHLILLVSGSKASESEKQDISEYARKFHNRNVEWVTSPGGDPDGEIEINHVGLSSFRTRDYESMIRFWISDLFHLAKSRGLKYVMRMDTDSVINSPIGEDLFSNMHTRKAVYGYRGFCYEWPQAAKPQEVIPIVDSFIKSEGLQVPFNFRRELDASRDALPLFYTNFEIVDVDFFSRADVIKFGMHMLQASWSGKIPGHHLGDAVIRALQVGLFADELSVLHLNGFQYRHGRGHQCVLEAGDEIKMGWGLDTHRFGSPEGHCCSRWSENMK